MQVNGDDMSSQCSISSDTAARNCFHFSILVIKTYFSYFMSTKSEHTVEVEHNIYWQICLNGAGNKSNSPLYSSSCCKIVSNFLFESLYSSVILD